MKSCPHCKRPHDEKTKWCGMCKERARLRMRNQSPEAIKDRHAQMKIYRETHKEQIKAAKLRYKLKRDALKAKGLTLGYTEDRRYNRMIKLLFEATRWNPTNVLNT